MGDGFIGKRTAVKKKKYALGTSNNSETQDNLEVPVLISKKSVNLFSKNTRDTFEMKNNIFAEMEVKERSMNSQFN